MPKSSRKTNKEKAIDIENLSVSFGSDKILNDISVSVQKGHIAALIGPNGSGKTTLVRTILGLIKPDAGIIRVFESTINEKRNDIGYVPQRFEFDRSFPMRVNEFLTIAKQKNVPRAHIKEVVKEVGLTPRILEKSIGSLSGGQLQRILIASAVLNQPKLLILDEPSTGVDIIGENIFYDIIKHLNEDHGTTILMISHDISRIADHVNQVICLNKKLICSGSPKKALTKKNLGSLFGENTHHHDHF
jgi:zinc transport system ATP-binding protein